MRKIILFGGTFEGRQLCQFLFEAGICFDVSVATEYGRELLKGFPGLRVHANRLNQKQMVAFFKEYKFDFVIDTTHPYATKVSQYIQIACQELKIERLRILRDEWEPPQGVITVENTEEAVNFLNSTSVSDSVLVVTGSKELAAYTKVKDFATRLFARVLPDPQVVAHCHDLGFKGRHLICMQGPFSRKLNATLLRDLNCSYLVTKDSGSSGGLYEKIQAVKDVNAQLVLIKRPLQEEGKSLDEGLDLAASKEYLINFLALK